MSLDLRGIWAPAATPVEDDLFPAPRLFAEHIRRLLSEGCRGIALFGTTGEATSFSVSERRALLDRLLEAGAPPERIIVGVGCCAVPDTVELARHAAGAGCAAVLMLPPFYYKSVPEEGLYRLFSETFDRLGADPPRTLLYHFPRLSQVPIPVALLDRLAQARPDVVAGIKDSSGDPDSLAAFLRARPDLAIFPGTEILLLDGLRRGAAGAITAGANVNAAAIRAVFDAHEASGPEADAHQQGVTAFRLVLERHPMIPAIKRILAERTGERIWANVRPPLLPLTQEEWEALVSSA
ncbi:MAG: dihydrodipicolinate synthase family protein [Planctomycetota bacterium]